MMQAARTRSMMTTNYVAADRRPTKSTWELQNTLSKGIISVGEAYRCCPGQLSLLEKLIAVVAQIQNDDDDEDEYYVSIFAQNGTKL